MSRFTAGFLRVGGYAVQLSLLCYNWSECPWERPAVLSPSPPSEEEPCASPQQESSRKSPCPAAALAPCPRCCPLSSSLCALSRDRSWHGLCPCSVCDASCFRLVGSDICRLWVAQKSQRYILTEKNPLPPPCKLHWLFLVFSHPLHSRWGQYSVCFCHCCHGWSESRRD